jgi:hypothetical protein
MSLALCSCSTSSDEGSGEGRVRTTGVEVGRWRRRRCREGRGTVESPSLVLVINDTKLLMPCVKCFELGISNTCDEGVCGKEWWPQDHKEMVHGHVMMIMVEMHIK